MTKDTQENSGNIQEIDVSIEFIERMIDFIENPMTYVYEVDLQSIDKCELVELQDVPIEVTNEQTEACIQEGEVVSNMALPEVYRVDTEKHTDVQLETPMIKSEENVLLKVSQKWFRI